MAEDRKAAIEIAWNSADSQFRITHQKEAAQVKEFKRGALHLP
jgi:hypothetical protein